MVARCAVRCSGFDAAQNVALIAATNRPKDLDAALISRFDVRVSFPSPDAATRALILARYAKQLSEDERHALAERAAGLHGRDLLDVCKHAERRWVCALLRGEVGTDGRTTGPSTATCDVPTPNVSGAPPLWLYEESIDERCAQLCLQTAGAAQS